MSYLGIVDLIILIGFALLGITLMHYLIFATVGLFAKKHYPKTDKINKYGVVIPARNEANVVAGLIDSIQKNNYPQDMLQIFVVAHNCTDNTAEVARQAGATVYEYNNPDERTKGYAFKHLFSCIERDYGTQSFDGFIVLDADNILDINFIARMNDAFEYYHRESVITPYRNSKNYGSNWMSGLYGMYFSIGCRLESCGRTFLGCSTRVQGTGYLLNSKVVKNGWPYVTLTEDWEFTADQIIFDNNIRYCDDAVFYDEQPTTIPIMWRQRVRWARGHLLVFCARISDVIKNMFKKGTKHRVSLYDITLNILPSPLFLIFLQILQLLLYALAPVFDSNVTLEQAFLGNSLSFYESNGLLFMWLRSTVISYVLMMLMPILVFITDHKLIKNVSIWKKIRIILLWPVFLFIQLPIAVQALFSRNLGWKPIPHEDQTTFDDIHDNKKSKLKKSLAENSEQDQ